MKTKRNIIALFTLCTALSITGCAGQETSKTENTQNTAAVSASESSADDSNAALDDLYQQENQIFADHKDVWDKVFGMMNKSTADPDGNYADYLADTVEANKTSFTDSELKTLTDDIKNRSLKLKAKMLYPILPAQKMIPMIQPLSRISPEKILMAMPLIRICFPGMP